MKVRNFKIQTNQGNEYLNYHNILETLRLNPYLYNPDFEIGVMDSGIYSNHEDFHTFYSGFLGGGKPLFLKMIMEIRYLHYLDILK